MKILFDFRSCQLSEGRGIGRYLYSLLVAMQRQSNIELVLLLSKTLQNAITDEIENNARIIYIEEVINKEIDEEFDIYFITNFFECAIADELHFPSNLIKKSKVVVGIMYDLIPMLFPKNYFPNIYDSIWYAKKFDNISIAKHIFTISEATKGDTVKFSKRPACDFTNILGSADFEKFRGKNSDCEYDSKNRTNNLIFISGDDARKNYAGGAKAFAIAYSKKLIPADSKLYIICHCSEGFIKNAGKAIEPYNLELGKEVIVTNFIPDEEIVELMTNAKASIFASFYEGLGLPVLESYAAGTPCIASWNSSLKELVPRECSFNPYDDNDVANKIAEIYNNEDLCKKSLNFGRNLLKDLSWDNIAKKVINKLQELLKKEKQKRIAVFASVPPSKSGVSIFSLKTHSTMPFEYDIITDIETIDDLDYALSYTPNKVKNIIPYEAYDYATTFSDYTAKIFVLGNSYHHLLALNEAIKTKGEENRYLFLHEALLMELLKNFCINKDIDFTQLLKQFYPNSNDDINTIGMYYPQKENAPYGILPLIELTQIKNIFVTNENAKRLILNDLPESLREEVKIDTMFHPVTDLRYVSPIKLKKTDKEHIIGSFGIPSHVKSSKEIFEAVKTLNDSGLNVKLILAGYGVEEFYQKLTRKEKRLVLRYESPSDELLYTLMKSVDLALQLRPKNHGETSGCIAQLLGLGIRTISTENYLPSIFEKYCKVVPPFISVENLAEVIKTELFKKEKINSEELIQNYSFEQLARTIKQNILEHQRGTKIWIKNP